MPVALEPDEFGLIFSGSAVVDRDDTSGFFGGEPGLVVIYTNHDEETEEQIQSIAYSTDRGRTWTKYSENPVILNPGIKDFRDPKVIWHEETQRWVLALAAGDRAMFYSSQDLKNWTELSEFGAEDGAHGGVWECPELFRLPVDGDPDDQKWVLLISVNPGAPEGGSGSQYFVGDFDGTTFSNDNPPETELWADYGKDFYAAQAWSDVPDGRRLWIGWMNNWEYSKEIPTDPWAGSMSLPREVTLTNVPGEGVRLVQTPVAELASLRTPVLELADTSVSSDGSNALSDLSGKTLELLAEFEPGTAREFGFRVRKGEEAEQETAVGYDAENAQLFVDRSDAGPADFGEGFPGRHEAPMKPVDGRVRMRIFVDHASVEVFGNDGVAAITDQIFPNPESEGLELYAEGGEARLVSLEAYDSEATQG